MRDLSFTLAARLFAPAPPFACDPMHGPPWHWTVRDATGVPVATARTRAGARAALRALYDSPGPPP